MSSHLRFIAEHRQLIRLIRLVGQTYGELSASGLPLIGYWFPMQQNGLQTTEGRFARSEKLCNVKNGNNTSKEKAEDEMKLDEVFLSMEDL